MSVSVTVDITVAGLGGAASTGRRTLTGDGGIYKDVSLNASATNIEVTLDFKQTDLTAGGLVLMSATEVTVKTNSTSVPDDTFTIPAGGFVDVGSLSADITKLYLTNTETDATVVYIRGAQDTTP